MNSISNAAAFPCWALELGVYAPSLDACTTRLAFLWRDVEPGCHWEAFLLELFSSEVGTRGHSVWIVRTQLKGLFPCAKSKCTVLTHLTKPEREREKTPFSGCVGENPGTTQRTPAVLVEFSTMTHTAA